MQTLDKKTLSIESEKQLKALKMIGRWRTFALTLSAVGMVFTYYGFHGSTNHLTMGIPGILLLIVGFAGAAILNLGIRNGKRNVEKMLHAMEAE